MPNTDLQFKDALRKEVIRIEDEVELLFSNLTE